MMNCKICSGEIKVKNYGKFGQKLLEQELCFTCHFYSQRLMEYQRNDNVTLVIDGHCYSVGDENASGPTRWRGFGGRKFMWKWNTGEEQTSTNLWSRGTIPQDYFRERMPDNAVWSTK